MNYLDRKCQPCHGGVPPLSGDAIEKGLTQLPGWRYDGRAITRIFAFKNYEETVAFVNAVTRIAVQEDHHPNIAFGYRECTVSYWTHAIKGISENDLICAAKVNAAVS